MRYLQLFSITTLVFSGLTFAAPSGVGADLYEKKELALDDIPAQALAAVHSLHPGFKVLEAEKEQKHGNHYLDLEGETESGAEIEFDLILNEDNQWEVVEIQRDLKLNECPAPVQALIKETFLNKTPDRIIESKQMDEVIVYEFYFANKDQQTTKLEIKLVGETATLLEHEWTH